MGLFRKNQPNAEAPVEVVSFDPERALSVTWVSRYQDELTHVAQRQGWGGLDGEPSAPIPASVVPGKDFKGRDGLTVTSHGKVIGFVNRSPEQLIGNRTSAPASVVLRRVMPGIIASVCIAPAGT
ncbi:MAG: hypothetical protein WCP28_18055 [Actinomycetes bacterium]